MEVMEVGSSRIEKSAPALQNYKRPDRDALGSLPYVRFFIGKQLSLRCEFEFNDESLLTPEWTAFFHQLVSLLIERKRLDLEERKR